LSTSTFANAERVLVTLAAMALFTLNEFRIYAYLPHNADPAHGQIYGIWMQLLGEPATAYLSIWDLAGRWALAGVTFVCAMWALAETFQHAPANTSGQH
jgi:hypothetical protein